MHPKVLRLVMGGMLLAASACEVVDRVRGRGAAADTTAAAGGGGALVLRLESPGMLRAGEEGTIRVSITNRGDSVPVGVRLDLFVPGWLEPVAPPPGGREVTMAATEEEGIRLSYRMDEPALRPGKTAMVEQRVRIPPDSPALSGGQPWGRVVRARLTGPDGRSVTEVESALTYAPATRGDSAGTGADTAGAPAAAAPRDRLGPVRLGMTRTALRQAAPGARDTTWSAEGTTERGQVVPLGGGGRAIALLSGDSVVRIAVHDSATRTREGLGVGSRFAELRAALGTACADAAEGAVVVWFPAAPGVSFALDVPPPRGRVQPDRIPGSARVTRWWLRRGLDRCVPAAG